MAGKLITLPLRVSLRSAQLLTRAAADVTRRVLSLAGHSAGTDTEGVERTEVVHPPAPSAPVAERSAASAPAPPEPAHVFEAGGSAHVFEAGGSAHVSEEPELVRESAEPGAEAGAGAAITVAEPWTGYGQMNARDLIDRTRTASVTELAAMRLYEARHRARQTVLAAVDRQLNLAGSGRPA